MRPSIPKLPGRATEPPITLGPLVVSFPIHAISNRRSWDTVAGRKSVIVGREVIPVRPQPRLAWTTHVILSNVKDLAAWLGEEVGDGLRADVVFRAI